MAAEESPLRNAADPERVADPDDGPPNQHVLLQNNDPSLTCLYVGMYDSFFPHEDEWGEMGACIGRHEHLKELMLGSDMFDVPASSIVDMCRGLVRNRSIETLVLEGDIFGGGRLEALIPFLEKNTILHLEIRCVMCYNVLGDELLLLGTVVSKFTSLVSIKIEFYYDFSHYLGETFDFEREEAFLVRSLGGHSGLRSITLEGVFPGRDCCRSDVTRSSCTGSAALASLLNKTSSSLAVLNLDGVTDDIAAVVGEAMTRSNELRELNITRCSVTSLNDWGVLFDALQSESCKLTSLSLHRNQWFETNYTTWLSRNTRIEKLDLSQTGLDDECANILANSLPTNNSLREVNLALNDEVSTPYWEEIFNLLLGPDSVLEKLDLYGNTIDNSSAHLLARLLANNRSVTELNFGGGFETITGVGWLNFMQTMCNVTSHGSTPLDVHLSNHTLEDVYSNGRSSDRTPSLLVHLLKLNRGKSESQAARLKVLECHFNNVIDIMEPLLSMDLEVLPQAVSWVAKDFNETGCDIRDMGLSMLYLLTRNLPALFDIDIRNKKRKRGMV